MNAPLPPHGMLGGGCLAAGGSGVSADLHLLLGMNRRTFVDSRGGGVNGTSPQISNYGISGAPRSAIITLINRNTAASI